MKITKEFEQRVRVLFSIDSTRIYHALHAYSLHMISCTLWDSKEFRIERCQNRQEYLLRVFNDLLRNLENYTFNIFSFRTNGIHIVSSNIAQNNRHDDRLIEQFSGYVPIFRARLDGYAPPIRLDEIDYPEKHTSSLPTLQVYIGQLKPGDLKSLLTTAKSLIKQILECVITGNEITGNNTIVVALAKSLTSTKELQWLLRIYDGSGKKVDNLDAMSIQKYL